MSADKFRGRYEVYDGYAGGAAPQRFSVDEDDIEDHMTLADLENLFIELADEDMREKTSVTKLNTDEFLVWAQGVLDRRGNA